MTGATLLPTSTTPSMSATTSSTLSFNRVKAEGLSYGSEPFAQDNMKVYDMWGGRGIYFHELNGHSIEIFTRRSPDGSYPP